MQCPNCNAALDIDIEHLQAYCPYCGTKLLFDLDQMNTIIAEKEKTKRFKIMQDTEITKERLYQISEFLKSDTGFTIAFFLGIGLLFLILILPFK